MTKITIKESHGNTCRRMTRFGAVIAFMASFSFAAESAPTCTGACVTGYNKCNDWCVLHSKNHIKCVDQCYKYWYSGTNPQSLTIGPSDPTTQPPRGPGQVKIPPLHS